MANTQVILLERVEKLGQMGDVVAVKPGFARNYLLPQKKALRANKDNVAYFEAQRKDIEAQSDKLKKEAQTLAKKLEGLTVPLIRQASESGQLFGSVSSRDISEGVSAESKETILRSMVVMAQNFKTVGLFPVDLILHPEVKVEITINIARTSEEAAMQIKSGKALVDDANAEAQEAAAAEAAKAAADAALANVLEEGALEAEIEKQADAEEKATEESKKAEEKTAAKAIEDAAKAKAATEAEEAADAEEASEDKKEDAS